MKTTNGIPCNDYLHTLGAWQNRIVYRFVSDGTNTPSSCTQIGLDRDRIFRMIREAVEKSKADD